ncbi:hypothetical protein [Sphingomonas aquatilis]|uniref:hypothetical protein n=1 Tax=Sphingomonas aquatilis TaxID=93063 RepID=UPI0023F90FC8|nr:hypothetical protein [Sphingomonas aquatilis]MCI4653402.1 hypothetical protein [Sphingomonas aquatilis]
MVDAKKNERPFRRRIELRWFVSAAAFHVIWFLALRLLVLISFQTTGAVRWCLVLGWLAALAAVSVEFGGRFKALNERTTRRGELLWALLVGIALPAITAVTVDQIKAILKDGGQLVGAAPAAGVVAWFALYGWVFKLPWDRFADLRKSHHKRWQTSVMFKAARLRRSHRRVEARLAEDQARIAASRRATVLRWAEQYPDWKMSPCERAIVEEERARRGCS